MLVFPLVYGPNYYFTETGMMQYPKTVIIPNSVKSLTASPAAFQSHSEIEKIIFEDNSPIAVFPANCFDGCKGLVFIENLPEGLTTINNYCFRNCSNLDNIVLPKSLTLLGSYCFQNCQILEEVDIPVNIKTIPSYCFSQCTNLKQLNIKEETKITSLGTECFADCSSLTDEFVQDIVKNVTSYGTGIFMRCHNLKELNLPHVAGYMFQSCDNLQTVTVTGNLTSNVASYAFKDCPKLETIIFTKDSKYTSIEAYAFQNCVSLKSVQLPPNTKISIGNYCFQNCSSLEEINLDNVTSLGQYCFQNAFAPISFTVPGSITTIGAYSFYGCKLTELILEAGITTLANDSFESCPNLITIKLPNTLTTIGQKAFYNDSALQEIKLPNSVKVFNSQQVFDYCASLEKATLSNQITTIPYLTFGHCTNLKTLEIPDSVTILAGDIIAYSGVESIYLGSGVTTINTNAFRYASELKDIYFNKVKGSITVPANKWGVPTPDNVAIHWLTSNLTFSSNVDLSQAKIFIEGNEVKNLEYKSETVGEVNFEAYHPDYLPLRGTITLSPPEEQVLDLQFSTTNAEGIEGVLLTIVPEDPTAVVYIQYNGVEFISNHILVEPNTEVSYKVKKDNILTKLINVVMTENLTINVPNTQLQFQYINVNISSPFDTNIETMFLTNLVDDNSFEIDESLGVIQSGPKSYNVNSGTSYGYIEITTPDYITELTISAYAQGENNYDFGYAYLGSAVYEPTQSQVKALTTDGKGQYLFRHTSTTYSDYQTIITELKPNTTYYLNFGFVKDGSGNVGIDRLRIKNINFTIIGSREINET